MINEFFRLTLITYLDIVMNLDYLIMILLFCVSGHERRVASHVQSVTLSTILSSIKATH